MTYQKKLLPKSNDNTEVVFQQRCGQCLVTLAFLSEKLSQPQFYEDLTKKVTFLRGDFGSL